MQSKPDSEHGDLQGASSSALDAEIEALALQLEEIRCYSETRKGKYAVDNPPDSEVAFAFLEREVQAYASFLNDVKFAHSIAHAVDVDGSLIANLVQQDTQAQQDRQLALQLNTDNQQHYANAPQTSETRSLTPAQTEQSSLVADLLIESTTTISEADGDDEIAGPSTAYSERQQRMLDGLSSKETECCTCFDSFRRIDIIRLGCGDTYCKDCLKSVITKASKDLTRFPPRCCRQPIPLSIVESSLSFEELDDLHLAEIEFSTTDKTYCANTGCGSFIPPDRIRAEKADCRRCNTLTCSMCKSLFHTDDCSADTALEATLNLAEQEGWRRCSSCRAMVELNRGCYHIT